MSLIQQGWGQLDGNGTLVPQFPSPAPTAAGSLLIALFSWGQGTLTSLPRPAGWQFGNSAAGALWGVALYYWANAPANTPIAFPGVMYTANGGQIYLQFYEVLAPPSAFLDQSAIASGNSTAWSSGMTPALAGAGELGVVIGATEQDMPTGQALSNGYVNTAAAANALFGLNTNVGPGPTSSTTTLNQPATNWTGLVAAFGQ
jgi:hypothetical protein